MVAALICPAIQRLYCSIAMSSPPAPITSPRYAFRLKTLPALKRREMWRYFGPAFVASVA